jgi:hypothetical protein
MKERWSPNMARRSTPELTAFAGAGHRNIPLGTDGSADVSV